MLHLPMSMLIASSAPDPYLKFLAWAASYQNLTSVDLNAQGVSAVSGASEEAAGVRVTFPANPDGYMRGSPWGTSGYSTDSRAARVVQHCFETEASMNANKGRIVVLNIGDFGGSSDLPSVNRHGYESIIGYGWNFMRYATLSYHDPSYPLHVTTVSAYYQTVTRTLL